VIPRPPARLLPLALLLACSARDTPSPFPATFTPPTEGTVLSTLLPSHPRLLVLPADLDRIRRDAASDPTVAGYVKALYARADGLLTQPVATRVLVGPRLLDTSRKVLDRIYTLGLAFRLGGDTRYRDRARDELLGVAAFTDWNPSHFLDVAEMTHAFAIGYDWLHADLTDAERTTVREALLQKGLAEGTKAYAANAWWTHDPFNWNLVCNGGLTIGALAVADEAPEVARPLLVKTIASMPTAMATYAPDGAWAEGPGYWGYATQYTVAATASLVSALGTDFGLSSLPGFSAAGDFRVAIAGPTGKFFNFADCGEAAGSAPTLAWLSRRFDRPLWAFEERAFAGKNGSAADLAYYSPRGDAALVRALPADALFEAAGVVTLRTDWTGATPTWIGFKGGDNGANHSHLDLGTFVLDALGERWAADLGPDDYNLTGYFGAERYSYYRLRTEGHNALLVGGQNQGLAARAPIVEFSPSDHHAIADLGQAYAALGVTSQRRGVALLADGQRAVVVDELSASAPVTLRWTLHTRATAVVAGDRVTLTSNGKTLTLVALAPADFTWQAVPVSLPSPQLATPGVTRLELAPAGPVTSARVVVLAIPDGASTVAPQVHPLADWKALGAAE
jgi:hypothetical protein